MAAEPMKILLELRPALDGHAGIPQEARLLFRGLAKLDGLQVDGLLQSGNKVLAKGLPARADAMRRWPEDRRVDRLSRVVVSLKGGGQIGPLQGLRLRGQQAWAVSVMVAGTLLGRRQALTCFEPARFEDFVWRSLFANTLPPEDFEAVTTARYRVARVPWSAAHASALLTRKFGLAVYPHIDTRGYDVMVAETPYPGRVSPGTQLVVRYHDAFPLLMPHTISDWAHHQASHYQALRRNVRDGAWFACVSDASRRDLISVFPQAAPRAVTIPNMVSHRYFVEDSPPERVPDILRTRANRQLTVHPAARRKSDMAPEAPHPPAGCVDYLLMVSTLEPRKNHMTMLAAWEKLRAHGHPQLQLVLVGMLGWDHGGIVRKLLPWVMRGQVHLLDDVPAAELRLLYRHARVTVCPSFGEGFGFSGVEAMQCGGVVAASDLPVHREIYGDAAEYFNPYSVDDLVRALDTLLAPAAAPRRQALIGLGAAKSADYLPAKVQPQWAEFLAALPALGSTARQRPVINPGGLGPETCA
jgi:glycosyltransferase involved in cell wall biosynthesis